MFRQDCPCPKKEMRKARQMRRVHKISRCKRQTTLLQKTQEFTLRFSEEKEIYQAIIFKKGKQSNIEWVRFQPQEVETGVLNKNREIIAINDWPYLECATSHGL
jgi:hypothetical protein